nr:MAG TPA: hypothetical protein [Caudoviricetes sp.]
MPSQDDNNIIYIDCQHFSATFLSAFRNGAPIFLFALAR